MPAPDHIENRNYVNIDLFRCPRQPGNLRITKHACALRHTLSRKTDGAAPTSEFGMARKFGLEICRSCPLGRLYAKDLNSQVF